MKDFEIKIINESIAAHRRMIKHLENQIKILQAKKAPMCCFEEKKIKRLKIKRR